MNNPKCLQGSVLFLKKCLCHLSECTNRWAVFELESSAVNNPDPLPTPERVHMWLKAEELFICGDRNLGLGRVGVVELDVAPMAGVLEGVGPRCLRADTAAHDRVHVFLSPHFVRIAQWIRRQTSDLEILGSIPSADFGFPAFPSTKSRWWIYRLVFLLTTRKGFSGDLV